MSSVSSSCSSSLCIAAFSDEVGSSWYAFCCFGFMSPGDPTLNRYDVFLKLDLAAILSLVGGGLGLVLPLAHRGMCFSAAYFLKVLSQWGHFSIAMLLIFDLTCSIGFYLGAFIASLNLLFSALKLDPSPMMMEYCSFLKKESSFYSSTGMSSIITTGSLGKWTDFFLFCFGSAPVMGWKLFSRSLVEDSGLLVLDPDYMACFG